MTATFAQDKDAVVVGAVHGRLGLVSLNRPKALNALSLEMVEMLDRQLAVWADDPAIDAVAIRGIGGKAFCAGGDVRVFGMLPTVLERVDLARRFFTAEYRLNHRIHTYAKPYVALLDGITMGGGAGLSIHGRYRVATAKTVFAMPETILGLYPDIGASWFLNRCPGAIGLYLGLTGLRIGAADMLAAGLATNVVESADIPGILDAFGTADRLGAAEIDAILAARTVNPSPGKFATHRPEIDRLFAGGSVEEIMAVLSDDGGELAREALGIFQRASPTSLKTTFRQLVQSRDASIAEVLRTEYRLSVRMAAAHDFPEGVRAILIDKDQSPRWQPDRLDAVSDDRLDALFAPFETAGQELSL